MMSAATMKLSSSPPPTQQQQQFSSGGGVGASVAAAARQSFAQHSAAAGDTACEAALDTVTRLTCERPLLLRAELSASEPPKPAAAAVDTMEDYYRALEEEGAADSDPYGLQTGLAELEACQDRVQWLLDTVDTWSGDVQRVVQAHDTVVKQAGALHETCNNMVMQQKRISSFLAEITKYRWYFEQLQPLTLQLPAVAVDSKQFVALIATLDKCINFMLDNGHFKEAPAYYRRYRALLDTALQMTRDHVSARLRAAASEAQLQAAKSDPQGDALLHDLAAIESSPPFRVFMLLVPGMRPLCTELERRALSQANFTLLGDCHSCYCQARKMQAPYFGRGIVKLCTLVDVTSMTRRACAYLIRLCRAEAELFSNFFRSDTATIKMKLLAGLGYCELLYEHFRPAVIHNHSIDDLCAVIMVLRSEMIDDYHLAELGAYASLPTFLTQHNRTLKNASCV
eukprot:TRINITY_DN4232_c0_g1_i2.p1 TRINITY_DN4232_c0_g1~~TRINITY_DN4232_c0_g1_i2.p1  ORF type:complete len:455 (+),score=147.86 TRINITY_DN4232_c0_g1_i2:8-1372(+)